MHPNIPDHIHDYLAFSSRGLSIVKDRNGNPIKINGKDLKVSKFDFKNLSKFTDEQIIKIIEIDLGINLKSEEDLKRINSLFAEASHLLSETMIGRILEKKGLKNIKGKLIFESIDDLIKFIRKAGEDGSGWEGKYKCMILKLGSAVNDILSTPKVNRLSEEKEKIVSHLTPIFQINDNGEEPTGICLGKRFVLYGRPKGIKSILYKNLNDPEYSNVESIKDNVGLTFEFLDIKNPRDYILAFEAIQNSIIALGGTISGSKVKGIDIDKINLMSLTDEQREIVGSLKRDKKNGTSDEYKDIKFTCEINGIKIEIKITNHENKNQEGLNFQGIYAYLSKYIEGIIMRHLEDGFITEEDMKMFSEMFFEELDTLLLENPETSGIPKLEYLEGLWNEMQEKEYIKGKKFIRKGVKMENRILEDNIRVYFIPGLMKYFKSKLIESVLEDGTKVWRNKRNVELSRSDILFT